MIELGPSRKRLSGDVTDTQEYHRVARKMLGMLMERMQRHGIKNLSHKVVLSDGTLIKVLSRFGQQTYEILVPDAEPIEVQIEGGIVCTPASDEVPNGWGFPYVDGLGEPINPPLGTESGTFTDVIYANGEAIRSDTWYEQIGDDIKVGHLDWKNEDESIILSIRGKNRHFMYEYSNFAGLNTEIYYNAKLLCRIPSGSNKIFGVAYCEVTDKLVAALVHINYDFASISFWAREWRDSYPNDYVWDELTNPLGWRKCGATSFSETGGSMAAFNARGNEVVITNFNNTRFKHILVDSSDFTINHILNTDYTDDEIITQTVWSLEERPVAAAGTPEDLDAKFIEEHSVNSFVSGSKSRVIAADFKANVLTKLELEYIFEAHQKDARYDFHRSYYIAFDPNDEHPYRMDVFKSTVNLSQDMGKVGWYLVQDGVRVHIIDMEDRIIGYDNFITTGYDGWMNNYSLPDSNDGGTHFLKGDVYTGLLLHVDLRYNAYHFTRLGDVGSNKTYTAAGRIDEGLDGIHAGSILTYVSYDDGWADYIYDLEYIGANVNPAFSGLVRDGASTEWYNTEDYYEDGVDVHTRTDLFEWRHHVYYDEYNHASSEIEYARKATDYVINAEYMGDQFKDEQVYHYLYSKADLDTISPIYTKNKRHTIQGVF